MDLSGPSIDVKLKERKERRPVTLANMYLISKNGICYKLGFVRLDWVI
jgi:hypothetical protein